MDSQSKRAIALFFVLTMIAAALVGLCVFLTREEDLSVEAKLSTKVDGFGYRWMDSKDPEPKVEYDWIDATKGTHLKKVKYSYDPNNYGNTYQDYNLPFSFSFYGVDHNKLRVYGGGVLGLGNHYDRHYYRNRIPYSGYLNGFIAPWLGYGGAYYSYGSGNFKVYAIEGQTYGERWVCFQWDKCYSYYSYSNRGEGYEVTFQAILYESGIIKFQYLDAESQYQGKGAYAVVGIENHAGNDGTQYSYCQPSLENNLAILFGKALPEIKDIDIDTDIGGVMYAQSRYYGVDVKVRHPKNNDMIRIVAVNMGGFGSVMYQSLGGGAGAFIAGDENDFVRVDNLGSRAVDDGVYLNLHFLLTPTFKFPVRIMQPLGVYVAGSGIMPMTEWMPEAFWVETKMEWTGSMMAASEEKAYIENGGWVKGGDKFRITGVKPLYIGTTITPGKDEITFTATDEDGLVWSQEGYDGICDVPIIAENDYKNPKIFKIGLSDVPPEKVMEELVAFKIRIDPFRPNPPTDLKIHADSFDDKNMEFDDDPEIYVTWEPANDYESGVIGYYVSVEGSLGSQGEHVTYVPSPSTSVKLVLDSVGAVRIGVWAVDKAGNPSYPIYASTKIDSDEVRFSEFSPGHQIWVGTHTPVCSILIDDGDGSGVSAKHVEYSFATSSMYEFGPWEKVPGVTDGNEVRVSVKTVFVNGKTNFIRFRAKDIAGNGWTFSPTYNVWVDEEPPLFSNFRPYEGDVQVGERVLISIDIFDIRSGREGSGVLPSSIEYRYSTQGAGLFGDWYSAPITSISGGRVHIEMSLDLVEGSDNHVQFQSSDYVGNYALSREFNIIVNSAPVIFAEGEEDAVIDFSKWMRDRCLSSPLNGLTYLTDEKILFDASWITDPDGDDLSYEWWSDLDGFLSSSPSFYRSISAGDHTITLIVNDLEAVTRGYSSSHYLVANFDIEVMEPSQLDPESLDSDSDGIYDAWEEMYGLNPYRPDSYIDSDHDTFNNLQEFQNGTDPMNPKSNPDTQRIVSVSDDDDADDSIRNQFNSLTLALGLIALIVVLVLIFLAFSKRRAFGEYVEDEVELEREEKEYRGVLDKRLSP